MPADSVSEVASVDEMLTEPLVAVALKLPVLIVPPLVWETLVAALKSVLVALTVVLSRVTEPVPLVRLTVEPDRVEPELVVRSADVASTESVVPAEELFNVTVEED